VRPIRVSYEADTDIRDSAKWYAGRSAAVATNFIDEVYAHFRTIEQFPNVAPRVRGLIRQLPVAGFPFVILYRPTKDHILVLRVFHTSQDPKKKK